jgi:hypothetical protein
VPARVRPEPLTLSRSQDNSAEVAQNPTQLPAPQDFEHGRDWPVGLPRTVQQQEVVGRCPSGRGQKFAAECPSVVDIIGGWQLATINSVNAGEP